MVAKSARPHTPRSRHKPHKRAIPARDKRALFVSHYLKHHSATAAAIHAGYSPRSAYSTGSDLLKHPEVSRALAEHASALAVSVEHVRDELAALAFSNVRDFVDDQGKLKPITELTRAQAAAVRKLKVTTRQAGDDEAAELVTTAELELADKKPALELLGRYLGMFAEDGSGERPSTFVLVIERPRSRAERERQQLEAMRNVTPVDG